MYQKTPPSNAFKIVYSDIYAILKEKDPEFLYDFEESQTRYTISANKELDSEPPQVLEEKAEINNERVIIEPHTLEAVPPGSPIQMLLETIGENASSSLDDLR